MARLEYSRHHEALHALVWEYATQSSLCEGALCLIVCYGGSDVHIGLPNSVFIFVSAETTEKCFALRAKNTPQKNFALRAKHHSKISVRPKILESQQLH